MTLLVSRKPSRASLVAVAVCVLVAIVSISLRAAIPVLPEFAAFHDDGLMVRLADSLMNGQWLGPWTDLTLAKGPGYPLFLAAIHPLGLTSPVAVQIVYLLGSALVAFGIWRWLRNPGLSTVVFVLLALNPVMYGADASRIYREGWTAALAIAVLGLAIIATQLCTSRSLNIRWISGLVAVVVALCVAITWLTLTRADTIAWVGPVIVLLAVFAIFSRSSEWRERLQRAGMLLGIGVFVFVAASTSRQVVADINEQHYGAAIVDDFAGGSYAAASNAWASVIAGPPRQWMTITSEQRRAVYEISATARTMRPYLEIPDGTGWKEHACRLLGMCDEAGGAWFPWMLRDAALSAVPIHNEAEFQNFFASLDSEITSACASGKLTCGDLGLGPGVPPPNQLDKALILANMGSFVRTQLDFLNAQQGGGAVEATTQDVLDRWKSVNNDFDYQASADQWNADPASPPLIAGRLREIYSLLAWVLVGPAIVGLVWGIFSGGRNRVASVLGIATATGVLLHAALLGLFFAATFPVAPGSLYTIASESFTIVTLCMGAWLCGRLIRSVLRGKIADNDLPESLVVASSSGQA